MGKKKKKQRKAKAKKKPSPAASASTDSVTVDAEPSSSKQVPVPKLAKNEKAKNEKAKGKKAKNEKARTAHEATLSGPRPWEPKKAWERRLPWLVGLFAFLLYANTLGHLYALDDNLVSYGHKYVEQGVSGIPSIWKTPFTYGATKHNDRGYRPVPLMLFALEVELFGKQAFFAQHLIHVLFYTLSCVLLLLLLRRLFWKWGPLFYLGVTLLFVAHPIHTEVVANLKSIDEIFGFLFGFLMPMLLMLRILDTDDKRWLPLLYVVFGVGMFSKENVITYLVVIPLTLYVFCDFPWRKVLALWWPLVPIVGFFLGVRGAVLGSYPLPEYDMLQNVLMGADGWIERYSTAMLVMLYYVWLLIFPHPLAWDYSYKQIVLVNLSDVRVWLSVALHVAILVFALVHIKQRTQKQLFAYAILFYLTVISVNSNLFVMTNCTLGERFLYVPLLGFCVVVVAGLYYLFGFEGKSLKKQWQSPVVGLVALLLVLYSGKTFARNFNWKDTLALSLADIHSSPKSIRVQSTLAAVYLTLAKREKNPKVRRQLYEQILPLAKKMLKTYPKHKEASYMLGICYYFLGQAKKAEVAFRSHLKRHPKDTKTYNNLGGLYYFRKDYHRALKYFHKFVEANPKDVKAINNLGVVWLNNLKRPDKAKPFFIKAIQIDPTFAEAYKRMGDVYIRQRQAKQALPWYEKAAARAPKKYAHLPAKVKAFLARQKGLKKPPGIRFPGGGGSRIKLPRSLFQRGKDGKKRFRLPPHILKQIKEKLRRQKLQRQKQSNSPKR